MSNLVLNNQLYDVLNYIKIHAIYERNKKKMYIATVDLFVYGDTYMVEFMLGDDGQVIVQRIKRWFMG